MKSRDRIYKTLDHQKPAKLKNNYGDRITFWGGIDTQTVLNLRDHKLIIHFKMT